MRGDRRDEEREVRVRESERDQQRARDQGRVREGHTQRWIDVIRRTDRWHKKQGSLM